MDDALDERQIRRAMHGDAEARNDLWRRERRFVAAVLHAHLPRPTRGVELEDVLQDVAMAFVCHLARLESPRALRSWLRTVAINAVRGALRRRRTSERGRLDTSVEHCIDQKPQTEAAAALVREEAELMLDHVHALPPDYREPLLLRCVHGYTQRQIAEALELPETTIESRLARARRMLRRTAWAGTPDAGHPRSTLTERP